MEIERIYEHKAFGRIGSVNLVVPDEGWSLDGQKLSADAVRHLATFALQSLQDAYAGADNESDARDNWVKKRDRIIEGTIGVREGGVRNPVLSRAISIAKGRADAKLRKDAKALTRWARAQVEKNPAFMDVARRQLEMEAEALGVDVDELPDE